MVFSSLTFLFIFLPVLLCAYFAIPHRYSKARNYVLLFFSILFYGAGEPVYVFVIFFCVLLTWILTRSIHRKTIYILTIAINLLPFVVLKYFDFFMDNLTAGSAVETTGFRINYLPLGISFYTFQILTYIIDLRKGKVERQENVAFLTLYVFLFPQLIAGPIVRYAEIEANFKNGGGGTWDSLRDGLGRFVIGLGKKVLVANQVGLIADTALRNSYNGQTSLSAGIMWLGALAYTMQIYFDFSGYSDMAIGLGKMFGFTFPENFKEPYISTSIREFWRRWHITLSSFFRDYVYIPLGGNRVKRCRWISNILFVWMLTGLWHGASWNFVVWGLYYAVLLIIETILIGNRPRESRIATIIRWFLTFTLIIIGWVIFYYDRESLSEIMHRIGIMFGLVSSDDVSVRMIIPKIAAKLPYLTVAILIVTPVGHAIKRRITSLSQIKLIGVVHDVAIILIFLMSIVSIIGSSYNPFIYFRF